MNEAPSIGSAGEVPVVVLIALNRDLVIESDLHGMLGERVDLVTTRVPLREVGSLSALRDLAQELPAALDLMRSASPSVVSFGCTSGVAAIGAKELREKIGEVLPGVPVVDPLSRILDGLHELDVESVALVTPYGPQISRAVAGWLSEMGLNVVADVRIDTSGVSHYAELPSHRIEKAVEEGASHGVDGVVLACTDLRALDLIESLETRVGVPVITSNQALARAVSDVTNANITGPGRLFAR